MLMNWGIFKRISIQPWETRCQIRKGIRNTVRFATSQFTHNTLIQEAKTCSTNCWRAQEISKIHSIPKYVGSGLCSKSASIFELKFWTSGFGFEFDWFSNSMSYKSICETLAASPWSPWHGFLSYLVRSCPFSPTQIIYSLVCFSN